MTRHTMCRYGNCEKPVGKNGVSVNVRSEISGCGERPSFCCMEHAGLWLLREAHTINHNRSADAKRRLVSQVNCDLRVSKVYGHAD